MRELNNKINNRRSIRLKSHDYSSAGYYFITICSDEFRHLFAKCRIEENDKISMTLTEIGEIVEQCWLEIPIHYSKVRLHEFVIMPNHIHGIIEIKQKNPTDEFETKLSSIIRGFKAGVTKKCKESNLTSQSIWHRNYYEHIIRNEKSFNIISNYIKSNPDNWHRDKYFDPRRGG